jgi:preprotein translocase subunit SecY
MFDKLRQIFKVKELRNKIFFVLALLIVFRLVANIPVPGIDQEKLKIFFSNNQFFGLLNLFSGRGLSSISIAMLGVGPYITSSIIMQLLTMVIPSLDRMNKEEGEAGREKFNQWTRWLTVPLAALQTFAMIALFKSQNILTSSSLMTIITIVFVAIAGTIFLMWLGELITEKKIGNGVSIIIFAGIVSGLPSAISQIAATWDPSQLFTYIFFLVIIVAAIAAIVFVTEGQRNIPVAYAKRIRGNKMYGGTSTHLPLRINQAGVIPIIFALSIMLFPGMVANFFSASANATVAGVARTVGNVFQNQWFYGIIYFILVVAFTYFYTAVVFDPEQISENLQKQGGYIPGIRPGKNTMEYLHKIMNRVTLSGALFLGMIAVLPFVVQAFTNIGAAASVGGTGLLIVVAVVIEIIQQIEGQLVMRDYEGF